MGLGLLFMFSSIVSLFNGSGFAAGLVAGIFGVGGLLGGWYLSEDPGGERGQGIRTPH
jgi:DNA polymerase-3 subunit epsilon